MAAILKKYIFKLISLKLVHKALINTKSTLLQKMDWRLFGAKPFSQPMMTLFTDTFMRHSVSMRGSFWYSDDARGRTEPSDQEHRVHPIYLSV